MKRTQIEPGAAARLAEALRHRGPLAGLPAPLLSSFIARGEWVELAAGESLMREGDVATEFYLLDEGALVVRSAGAIIARLDKAGDVAGEAAVIMKTRRTADVVAETPTRAVAIAGALLPLPEFADITSGIRASMLRDDWVEY